ncbi:threonine synthase [Helicobacter sp. 23-1044]
MQKMLVETRGNDGIRDKKSDFFSAVLNPEASFGGLWTLPNEPKSLPKIDLNAIKNLNYNELISYIFERIGIDWRKISLESYKNFDNPNLPLSYTKIEPNIFLQNLFTGPTRAFKDMAMQPFGALLCDLAKRENSLQNKRYLILSATSGDTGPATLEAIKNKPNIFGICMFPKDGTSAVQRLQMTTNDAKNIAVLEVDGNFDDTQNALKNLLNDSDFRAFLSAKNLHLSASNSVNFGRIAFQIIYHIHSYIFLRDLGAITESESFDIVVPSGNFGNALGAFYAKLMGVPIAKIIIATNANNVLETLMARGVYDISNRTLIKTNSPAMDILKSSNVERVLFALFGANRTKDLMSDLEAKKCYKLSDNELSKIQEIFDAFSFDDESVLEIIAHYAKQNIIIDPHSANAILGAKKADSSRKIIVCSTAEWCKFVPTIKSALDSANLMNLNAESTPICHSRRSEESKKSEKDAMLKISQKFNLKIHKNIRNLFDKDEVNCTQISKDEIKNAIVSICNKFLEI